MAFRTGLGLVCLASADSSSALARCSSAALTAAPVKALGMYSGERAALEIFGYGASFGDGFEDRLRFRGVWEFWVATAGGSESVAETLCVDAAAVSAMEMDPEPGIEKFDGADRYMSFLCCHYGQPFDRLDVRTFPRIPRVNRRE